MGDQAIALWGFMGSGKSTVGAALARRRGWDHVDLDVVLTRRFGPIAVQFAEEGEAAFRQREAEALAELCDGACRVLSLGGGTPVAAANRRLLGSAYQTVFLDAPWTVLRERVVSEASGAGDRPLWGEEAAELYARRRAVYLEADAVVSTADRTVEQVVAAIEEVLCSG